MFEQTFKNIDDILHKDAGCSSELDYVEQSSWVLFLKYLDDLEKDKRVTTLLTYTDRMKKCTISTPFSWMNEERIYDGKTQYNFETNPWVQSFLGPESPIGSNNG